jgi:UDP-N-acetylmuramoyl-L-alanyl-D-glutamate--2,6-diaminopimelate ligase
MARNVPTLAHLIDALPVDADAPVVACAKADRTRAASIAITGLSEHSRRVQPGHLFIARPGTHTDGRRFVADAVAAGAAAVLTTADAPTDMAGPGVIVLRAADVPSAAAQLAEAYYDRPSAALSIIGVTGTNGKTTVAHLVRHLLAASKHHAPCGMIGTAGIDVGPARCVDAGSSVSASSTATSSAAALSHHRLTTPSCIDISRALRAMVDNGCRACAMECSSHGLAQQRTAGVTFDVAVFTNLSGDHQDYHVDMNAYAAAKAMLFAQLQSGAAAIINVDDPVAQVMIDAARSAGAIVQTCSLEQRPPQRADWQARVTRQHLSGTDVTVSGPDGASSAGWQAVPLSLPLLGVHNVMNVLQAIAVAHHLGVERDALRAACATITAPPGRFERVTAADDRFTVLVDFAHTDDGLDKALAALRPVVTASGRLHVVFGCGGEKDRTKRPRMARTALRWADSVIVTSDNPRHEDPDAIIDDIMAGVDPAHARDVQRIVDRRAAIDYVINDARPGDLILIAGKGDETEQVIGDDAQPFDDRVVAREALARLGSSRPTHVETAP